ncbi:MAG: exo-alpha-sialidase [Clostridiaceae bacterium]|nr:exo-alpha-sialidase [Clostridiaceae bacterium]
MKIISRGIIPKPVDNPHFNSNTFPALTALPSGRWLAAFRTAVKKGDCDFQEAVMTYSDDLGKSWSAPYVPFVLPDIDGVPGQCRGLYFLALGGSKVLAVACWVDASDPSLPFYDPETEGLKDTRIFYAFSEDEGLSWTEPQLMDMGKINDPVPLTGPPMMLKDGTVVCQFEINKHLYDPTKWVHKSALIFSADGGETWRDPVIVTEVPDMYYWDQRPTVMSDGRTIVDFFWTFDGKSQQYLNIHARESTDGGRTWGDIWDTGIYGQPGQPADLGDGRLALIAIDRSIRPIITVYISSDRGRSFDESFVVYDNQIAGQDSVQMDLNAAWAEMAKFSVGHPNLIPIGKDELLAFYYAGTETDYTSVEFVRLKI